MLKLKNMSVAYKDHKVLDNLSFTANKGEIIGLAAPNGMGKTTMFNAMANFLKPNSGQVIFNGKHQYKSEKSELFIHKHLATFPDQGDLFEELSGIDHINLYGNMWSGTTKHTKDITKSLQMDHYVKGKVSTYSLGMRQRLCFAMMVAADTSIMLMDEVMNGLDVENVALISERLIQMKEENKLIFVASHLLDNLDLYADRVIFLKGGKIIYEQQADEATDDYLKIDVDQDQYEAIKKDHPLPSNHLYIANRLLCIPLDQMTTKEQTTWIERLLALKERELSIGPLGTMEHYEQHYHE